MIRVLGMVIGIFCTATVLTAALTLGFSWQQGNLTNEAAREIIAVLKGEPRPSDLQQEEETESMSSFEQLEAQRMTRILGITARENELAILKQAIDDQANFVIKERKQIEQVKSRFLAELEEKRESIVSEAVTQARGILLKMEPESAVEKLISLGMRDAVVLMKGMPAKDAARILDQFRLRIAGKEPDSRTELAEEIYQAIYRGEPLLDPVDTAQRQMDAADSSRPDSL